MGEPCFAEQARRRAAVADVIVVNTHLYGLDVGTGGVILPEHDVVVFDEAHGARGHHERHGRRLSWPRGVSSRSPRPCAASSTTPAGGRRRRARPSSCASHGPHAGQRLPTPVPRRPADAVARPGRSSGRRALHGDPDAGATTPRQRKLRAQLMTGRTIGHLDLALEHVTAYVDFVSGSPEQPRFELAPLDVGPTLRDGVWAATDGGPDQCHDPVVAGGAVGLARRRHRRARRRQPLRLRPPGAALLRPPHARSPRSAGYREAVHDELAALITAAGGRTLALFTSWKAMDPAAAAVRGAVDVPILTQRDLPKPALAPRFADAEATCLFATAGFFQGVDVPAGR